MSTIASMVVAGRIDATQFNRGILAMVASVERFGETVRNVGRRLSTFLTLPILGAGAATIKMASDAGESASKLQAVFGRATDSVNEAIVGLRASIPETTQRLQDFTSDIYALLNPMGVAPGAAKDMSLAFVQLAGDIASFRNERIEDVFVALRSGLVGETEPVRRFGVSLNQVRIEAEAMREGLFNGAGQISSSAKATAAFNIILHDTALAHGDAARTAGSAANQMKFFGAGVRELATSIGKELLPIFTPLVTRANEWLKSAQAAPPATIRFGLAVAAIVAVVGPLVVALGAIVSGAAVLFTAFSGLGALLTGPVGLALLGTVALFALLKKNMFGVSSSVESFRTGIGSTVPTMSTLTDIIANLARAIGVFAAVLIGRLVASVNATITALFAKIVAWRASAAAALTDAQATLVDARAQVVQTGAILASLRARLALMQAQRGSAAASNAERATLQALVVAERQHAAAAAAATVAEEAQAVALTEMSVAARIATASMGGLKAALAFFGGPIGIAITLALAAVSFAFINAGKSAREAAEEAKLAAEEFRAALLTMDDATVGAKFYNTTRQVAALTDQIDGLEALVARQKASGALTVQITVDRGITQTVNTELGNAIAHNERALAELRRLRASAEVEQRSISDELARRQDLQRQLHDTTGALAVPDVVSGGVQKAQTAAQALQDQVQRVVTRLEYARQAGLDIAEPLRAARDLHTEILQRIQAQGGAIRAETYLLEGAQSVAKALSDTTNLRERVQNVTSRLQAAFTAGVGVREAIVAARRAQGDITAEIERQGGVLKANNDLLDLAATMQAALSHNNDRLLSGAGGLLQHFQEVLQATPGVVSTALEQQITATRDDLLRAFGESIAVNMATIRVPFANPQIAAMLKDYNDALVQIQLRAKDLQVPPPIKPQELAINRTFEALERRAEGLADRVSDVKLQFTKFGIDAALAGVRLRVVSDVLQSLSDVSPAALLAGVVSAVYVVSRELLSIVDPLTLLRGAIQGIAGLGEQLVTAMNPLAIVFQAIGDGLRQGLGAALDKLAPLVEQIAYAFGQVLGPVIEALAPVIEALAPLVIAVAKVFALLFTAVSPILEALVPLLGALFPVFQAVAIAATYVGQVFFTVAEGILRVVAFFVDAVGSVIKTLGNIINAITPFANPGNPLVRAGEFLQRFAGGLRSTADGFGEAVDALGEARKKIKDIVWDEALGKVGKLGDAAQAAAESVFNLPNAYKLLNFRRFQAADALTSSPAAGAVRTSAPSEYMSTNSSTTMTVVNNNFNIKVDAKDRTPTEFFDMIKEEGKRQARAQFGAGGETRWGEVT